MRKISWADVDALEASLRREIRGFRVVYKDENRIQRILGIMLLPINRVYLTHYTTVMFGRVYFPSRQAYLALGPEGVYQTLRHEAVHLRDMQRYPIFFHFTYLFVLPLGPGQTSLRAWWEWRAYLETLRVEAEIRGDISDALLNRIERHFTGPNMVTCGHFVKICVVV